MASKRRIRRQACSGKQRFATSQEASDAMHALIRSGKQRRGWLNTYRCSFCKGYHYGHARTNRGTT